MADIIVALTILLIIALSISKLVIDKRKGMKCAGCALSGECSANKGSNNKALAQRIEIKELT